MENNVMDDLKKLPPEERIKRLKELEKEREKQEDEAKKLLVKSIEELELDEATRKIEIPEQELIDVSKLFDHEEEDLEDTVDNEKDVRMLDNEENPQYRISLDEITKDTPDLGEIAAPIYNRLLQMKENSQADKALSIYDHNLAQIISEQLPKFKVDYTYSKADEVVKMLVASAKILEELGYSIGMDGHGLRE